MADPGLPERLARHLGQDLGEVLNGVPSVGGSGQAAQWDVQVSQQKLPLDSDGRIPLMSRAEGLLAANEWDFVVYLTDLPRSHDHQTLLSESDSSVRAMMVSLPALGWFRVKNRLLHEVVQVMTSLAVTHSGADDSANSAAGDRNSPSSGGVRNALESGEADQSHKEEGPAYQTVPGRRGRRRLLGGMVRNNGPGRLAGSLTSASAAAMATGAFGIFYASVWNMADSSSTLRLSLISVFAVLALTGWLIIYNGLWSTKPAEADRTPAPLDNAATVITVLLSVAVMYAGLYLAVLLGSLAIISGHYMQAQLGHPVSIVEYANLSWLSASLGMLAGALGSNFDGDTAVRRATYGGREQERRELAANEDTAADGGE